MRFGKIPTTMTFLSAAAKVFKCGWEDINVSLAEDIKVIPCFPADAESADSIAQGRKWARDFNQGQRLGAVSAVEESEANTARKLIVVGLEKRQEGGRSFKVLDDKKRLFDLREDVLLETLLSVGSSSGGKLNGEFVFARIGSQMRLIRVGSSLHATMLKSENRRQSKNVAANELVIGGVYANRRGLVLYLGRIDTIEEVVAGGRVGEALTALGQSKQKLIKFGKDERVVNEVLVEGEHLSIALSKYEQAEPERALSNALTNAGMRSVFQFGKSITAVELVSQLQLPANIIERIRMRSLENTARRLHSLTDAKFVDCWGEEAVCDMNRDTIQAASAMLNIRAHGVGATLSPEYLELLNGIKQVP